MGEDPCDTDDVDLGEADAVPLGESDGDEDPMFMSEIAFVNTSAWATFFAPVFEFLDFFDDPRGNRVLVPSSIPFVSLCSDI